MINVAHQVPEFVRSDYPGFVEFLKAYYKWYEEEYGIGNFGDLIDIDTTIDSFLQYFRKELDIFGITNDDTSRFYLRHLKELYTSKGSSEAVKFLFKILYDKNSTIRLPWDYTLIASGGEWRVPFSIILGGITIEQAEALIGNEITVIDTLGNPYKTMVEYVNVLPSGKFEIFIGKIGYGRLSLEPASVSSEDAEIDGIDPEVGITGVSVVDGGENFTTGTVYDVPYAGATGLQVRVTGVSAFGAITSVEIIAFGDGYTSPFNFVINGGEGTPDVTFYPLIHVLADTDTLYLRAAADGTLILGDYTIVTADAGDLPHDLQTGDAVIYRKGDAANDPVPPLVDAEIYYVIRVTATKLKLATSQALALAGTAINLTTGATGSGHTLSRLGDAVLHFDVGTVRKYPGYYIGSGSVLGDGCFIEDSFYYQVYSYVTILEERLAKYKTILMDVLHPAGTKNFGEYVVSLDPDTFEATIDLEMDVG